MQQFSKKQQRGKKDGVGVISTRAREIARSALNLSDLELDEFFSDKVVKVYINSTTYYVEVILQSGNSATLTESSNTN